MARSSLAAAIEARRQAADAFDAELLGFRRVVRTELGRTSPEYQSIRARRSSGEVDELEPVVTPAPVA